MKQKTNMLLVELLNDELDKIWDRHLKDDQSALRPVYFRESNSSQITFVGMNPSFNKKGIARTIKGTEFDSIDIDTYFMASNTNFKVQVSNEIDKLSKVKYSTFFKHHHDLSKEIGVNWNHLDLFHYRQTNQKEFTGKIENADKTLNEFGKAQFDLFIRALKLTAPKLIIVINAKASRIFQSNCELVFSDTIGTYEIDLGGTKTPVFLSGMLTGGRALDVFSRERLFWHIKQVYDK